MHASASRVILVSSTEARRGQLSPHTTHEQLLNPAPYDGWQVYRNTKQANLLFAQELHRRCIKAGSPVSAVAVHPGASATNLFASQLDRAGRGLLAPVSKFVTGALLQSATAGALSTLRALDRDTPSGAFVGPSTFGQLRGPPELLDVYACAKDPADGGTPLGPHRAGARRAAVGLTAVDTRTTLSGRAASHVHVERSCASPRVSPPGGITRRVPRGVYESGDHLVAAHPDTVAATRWRLRPAPGFALERLESGPTLIDSLAIARSTNAICIS